VTKLVSEIIQFATDDKESVSVLLRKCLVLSYELNNEHLKNWSGKELDGYDRADELPPYRVVHVISKGTFLGGGGNILNDQPLNHLVMDEEHRHFCTEARLNAPIASYELGIDDVKDNPIIEWPPAITTRYQTKFVKGGWALNRAWQLIPSSAIVGLVATVRNRILRFTLELRTELGVVGDNIERLPREVVDRNVINIIYGGNTVIAKSISELSQINNVTVIHNDIKSLQSAMSELGLRKADIDELKLAIEQDARGTGAATFGERTKAWLKNLPAQAATGGLKMSVEIAKTLATKFLLQYFGIN
jgi:hypothetical protein